MDRRDLFLDDHDRHVLVDRLETVLPDEGVGVFAWALLANHVHLAVRSGERAIGRAVHRVATAYAGHFNARYGHEGHVFQGRFGSRWLDGDADLARVVEYVHQNPLAARIVGSEQALASYTWAGYGALFDASRARAFHGVRGALALFGESPPQARDVLRRRVEEAAQARSRAALDDSSAERLDALIRATCDELQVPEHAVRSGRKSHGACRVREIVARVARRELAIPEGALAESLGVSRQALWQRIGARSPRRRGT